MQTSHTEADFERLSWHDCHIWGLAFRVGDPDENDWTSDLVLDIDFILDWICGAAGGAQFQVAPAALAFHGVTDPRIGIEIAFGPAGFTQTLLAEPMLIEKQHLSLGQWSRVTRR
jgi:hypothetical protein